MDVVKPALVAVVGLALAISAVTDLRTRKIRDIVTVPALLLCLIFRATWAHWGEWTGSGLASGLLGMLAAIAPFLPLCLMGGMGMGDIKLMAVVGAGAGFPLILICLICICIAGGLEAVVVLTWKGELLRILGGTARRALRKRRGARAEDVPRVSISVPYGLAIGFGTAWGAWLTWNAGYF
jgi:prepilin peptidase CpaA